MDLIHTPASYAYLDPVLCSCGERSAMRGFQLCRCAGAEGSGVP